MNNFETSGYCSRCDTLHRLGSDSARLHAEKLMQRLESEKRIDFDSSPGDPRFSIDYLFGEARGQMFGVLECLNDQSETVVLKAFSCQYNGIWEVEGWVPPVLDLRGYETVVPPVEKRIKELGRQITAALPGSAEAAELKKERKELSQQLMKEIHALYELRNFCSEKRPLSEVFGRGIPTGAADCCAPKLLQQAAVLGLKPLSLAEFFWGRSNRSETRRHGEFYKPCKEKCLPILGFMLCGADS